MSEISINAQVECVDGTCGQVITMIVDRTTRKVTHLVIEDETLPWKPYQRMVPIDQLAEATRDPVSLRCKREDVAQMQPFIHTHYIKRPSRATQCTRGEGESRPMRQRWVFLTPRSTRKKSQRAPSPSGRGRQ